MNQTFPKDITDRMRDCILAIFWPKEDIISFFKDNGCTIKDLKDVQSYKAQQLSRAKIVNLVFSSLKNRSDGGIGQYRSIIKSLLEWDSFDPYYFEVLKKLNVEDARDKLGHLKQLQEIRDNKFKKQKIDWQEKEKKATIRKTTLNELKNEYLLLYQLKDIKGDKINNQRRGYLLESFLQKLLFFEDISTTKSISLSAEQIDGTLKFEGENYIFEAKWHDVETSTNALYHFAYKVEGKLYGRGIFISTNGFSQKSIEMLIQGKSMNTILFDGGDLALIVEGMFTFKEMLEKKVLAAQTMGYVYIDVNTMKPKQGFQIKD